MAACDILMAGMDGSVEGTVFDKYFCKKGSKWGEF